MCKLCSDIDVAQLMPYIIQVFAQTLKFAPLTRPVCIDIQESGLSDAECKPETTTRKETMANQSFELNPKRKCRVGGGLATPFRPKQPGSSSHSRHQGKALKPTF